MDLHHRILSCSCAIALVACDVAAQCGTTLSVQPAVSHPVATLTALADGRIAVGGWFVNDPPGASRVAIFDPATQGWDLLAGGCSGTVQALAQLPNGDLIAAGHFTQAGGAAVENIARWNGAAWSPLGGGSSPGGATATIYSLLVLPNGDLLAGGDFEQIEGTAVQGLARWDGSAWSSIGYPYLMAPVALTLAPNGDLIVVDLYAIERYSGGSWSIAALFSSGSVNTATGLADGSSVAAGHFFALGSVPTLTVARLQGGVWSALGGGVDGTAAGLTQLPDGDLIVVGAFDHAFDASGTKVVDGIARWDGQQWSAVASAGQHNVQAIVRDHEDRITFAGYITLGGSTQNRLATLASTCPALATPSGPGCAGSSSAVTLAAETRPWLSSVYAARASGLSPAAVGLDVIGLAPASLPLATVLPAGPSCFLYTTADLLGLLLPTGGEVTTQLAIPDSAALVGATFHQQVLALELGGTGLEEVSASNALLLTAGVF